MNDIDALRALDHCLERACFALQDAAQLSQEIDEPAGDGLKRRVADSLIRLWEIRSSVHSQVPELTPQFVAQAEAHPDEASLYLLAVNESLKLAASGAVAEAQAKLEAYVGSAAVEFFAGRARERLRSIGGKI